MDRGQEFWRKLAHRMDLHSQPLPGVPLVELAGDSRVLLENHQGVLEYTHDRIGIRVKFGCVVVQGQGLELCHMTRQRLVIYGKIRSVTLEGRE